MMIPLLGFYEHEYKLVIHCFNKNNTLTLIAQEGTFVTHTN